MGFADWQVGCKPIIKTIGKDEEYYVFLKLTMIQDNVDMLNPVRNFESTGGLFQVMDGKVQDPDNFWGLGTIVEEIEFVNNIKKLKTEIESWFDYTLSVNDFHTVNTDLIIYPNPVFFGDNLNVIFNSQTNSTTEVSLYNLYGAEAIRPYKINLQQGINSYKINAPGSLSPGVYFLRVSAGSEVWARKVIIIDS